MQLSLAEVQLSSENDLVAPCLTASWIDRYVKSAVGPPRTQPTRSPKKIPRRQPPHSSLVLITTAMIRLLLWAGWCTIPRSTGSILDTNSQRYTRSKHSTYRGTYSHSSSGS
jgi:hypothetical protein